MWLWVSPLVATAKVRSRIRDKLIVELYDKINVVTGYGLLYKFLGGNNLTSTNPQEDTGLMDPDEI